MSNILESPCAVYQSLDSFLKVRKVNQAPALFVLILARNRRDRHAKTLDIAQEEVLTCLGIHIYERLHKIGQKLRQEEQTWRLLFCLGVETLKKNFEVSGLKTALWCKFVQQSGRDLCQRNTGSVAALFLQGSNSL